MTAGQAPDLSGAIVVAEGQLDSALPYACAGLAILVAGSVVFALDHHPPAASGLLALMAASIVPLATAALRWRSSRRSLVVTTSHLVSVRGGRAERWTAFADLERLRFECTTRRVWVRGGHYSRLFVHPPSAVHPARVLVTPLTEVLLRFERSREVADRLAGICHGHHLDLEVVGGTREERRRASDSGWWTPGGS